MAFAPIVVAVTIGLTVGAIRRGRLTSVAQTRIRFLLLFAIAFGCGLALDLFDLPAPGVWAGIGLTAGLLFAVRNVHLVGMMVIAIGVAANLLPVALNGATPVRAEALVEAGMVTEADVDRVVLSGARELIDGDTVLSVLGDVVPLAAAGQVVSFGDIVILVGLASVITNLMLQRRPRRVPPSALASLETLGWSESSASEGSIIELRTQLRPVSPTGDQRELVGASSETIRSPTAS